MSLLHNSNLHILIYIIAATQSSVAGAVFVFLKGDKAPLHPRLLAGLFFLMGIVLFDMAIERTSLYHHYPQFGNIGKMLATALPGLVYLYARMTYLERFRLYWYDALHCLPLLLKGGAALFFYHLQPTAVQLSYWQQGWQSHPINWPWLSTLAIVVYAIQIGMLMRLVHRHHKALQQVRSNTLDRSYRLLKVFAGAYSFHLILNVFRAYLVQIKAFDTLLIVTTVMGLWVYVIVTLLIIDLILGSDRRNRLSEEEAAISGFAPSDSVESGPPTQESEHWIVLKDKLESYMREHKPFLDPNLTLIQVARKLGVPGRDLSGYINAHLGCNFSDYIASWRIAEVKEMLNDQQTRLSITDISYACGFNSKSVFYNHFKKREGVTPSQWLSALAQ